MQGDTVNAGIGQGYLLVSPLQLAYATAVLAGDGKLIPPRLASHIDDISTALADHEVPRIEKSPTLSLTLKGNLRSLMTSFLERSYVTSICVSY